MSSCVRFLVFLLFALLSGVAAQTPAGLEEKKALLAGQVLNAITGEPIRRAGVLVNRLGDNGMVRMGPGARGPAFSASTDANGRFTIAGIEPGNYMISAEKVGFLRGFYGPRSATRAGSAVKVSAGQEIKDIQFKLMPQAVLTGRVVDEEGEPVQNVPVQVVVQRYFRGRRQRMPSQGVQTNDKGEYRLANLSPGKYVLSVAPTRITSLAPQPADGSPETGYATLYYPGVQDLAQATRIDVAAGVELGGLDFRLQRTRVYRIRGKVADPNGAPMKNVFISLSPRGAGAMFSGSGSGTRASDGSFEIPNVTPGSYVLLARAMESGQQVSIQYPVDVAEANVDGIVLTPAKAQVIEGTVKVEGGDSANVLETRVVLSPADSGAISAHSDSVKADGTFTMTNVFTGRYQVMVVNPAEGTYVASVKLGGQEVLGQDVNLSPGVPGRLDVTLKSGAGRVNGTAIGSEGANGMATVVLVPQDSRRNQSQFYQVANTDQNGGFSFGRVAPGDYKVFAWEDVESGAWEDPEFMRPLEDQGVSARVAQRGTENVRVKVIPAAK